LAVVELVLVQGQGLVQELGRVDNTEVVDSMGTEDNPVEGKTDIEGNLVVGRKEDTPVVEGEDILASLAYRAFPVSEV
jgi:hypothetical protein